MPLLAPVLAPPISLSESASTTSSIATSTSQSSMSPTSTAPTSPERTKPEEDVVRKSDARTLTIPAVRLDAKHISEEMAARLSISLLGHVLFLKSQVPFPVVQLARMPGGKPANSRAAKKRAEFINAFDELSSHLHTTFSALSTALAMNAARYPELTATGTSADAPTATAYLSVVLGPTVGTAKARVMLAMEGLEVKIWGTRDDDAVEPLQDDSSSEEEEGSQVEDSDADDEDEASESSDNVSGSGEDGPASSDEDDVPESPPSSEPALSRTPSLRGSSPPIVTSSSGSPQNACHPPPSRRTSAGGSVKPRLMPQGRTLAEEEQTLRVAERLLSRTLANACADGPGMACEMAPTQTHILLRAPRCFSHPAWVPRQNLTSSLETVLSDFLQESGLEPVPDTGKRRQRKGVLTEGVWIGCAHGAEVQAGREEAEGESDQHEMIWWCWNGRLAGFAEW